MKLTAVVSWERIPSPPTPVSPPGRAAWEVMEERRESYEIEKTRGIRFDEVEKKEGGNKDSR